MVGWVAAPLVVPLMHTRLPDPLTVQSAFAMFVNGPSGMEDCEAVYTCCPAFSLGFFVGEIFAHRRFKQRKFRMLHPIREIVQQFRERGKVPLLREQFQHEADTARPFCPLNLNFSWILVSEHARLTS